MGNGHSLLNVDGFSSDEISRLEKRFKKLDLDASRCISVEEFLNVPELKDNPLVRRVVDVFDSDRSGDVDFKEFVIGLTQMEPESKLRFLFKIYDLDGDGFISNSDLFKVMKMLIGKNLNDTQLQQMVDKTIIYATDKNNDGKVSFQEFQEAVSNKNLENELHLDKNII